MLKKIIKKNTAELQSGHCGCQRSNAWEYINLIFVPMAPKVLNLNILRKQNSAGLRRNPSRPTVHF